MNRRLSDEAHAAIELAARALRDVRECIRTSGEEHRSKAYVIASVQCAERAEAHLKELVCGGTPTLSEYDMRLLR